MTQQFFEQVSTEEREKKNLQNDLYSIAYSTVINNEQKQITGNVFNRREDKLGHIYTTVYLLIRKSKLLAITLIK